MVSLALLVGCGGPDDDGDGWTVGVDCDDADAAVHPSGAETCNGVDDDCDGVIDAWALDATAWFADADGDGSGDSRAATFACDAPTGAVADGLDCDDTDPDAFPGATERCNGLDDDCDRRVDEDVDGTVAHYADLDGDGHGDAAAPTLACAPGAGAVSLPGDCDDGDAGVHPGAPETCDGIDQDCDLQVDEEASDAMAWHPDVDGDGFGAAGIEVRACAAPVGHLADATDCDDGAPDTWPGAIERCDGDDDDCDGVVDGPDPVGTQAYYADADGDGFGDDATEVLACDPPPGTVELPWDCDDLDRFRSPVAAEVCDDGVDNDCDGAVDGCGGGGGGLGDLPLDASEADVVLDGPASTSSGESVALADLDGDGADDLLVGGSRANVSTGRVWMLYGLPGSGMLAAASDASWDGDLNGGEAGAHVAGLGDLDGDGYEDVATTARTYGSNSIGALWFLYGGPTRAAGVSDLGAWDVAATGLQTSDYLGYGAPVGLGDLDHDGYDDAAFAAYGVEPGGNNGGAVYLVYGGPTRLPAVLDETLLPTLAGQDNDQLCTARCIAAPDLDGDGEAELVTGGYGYSGDGRVYVRYGDGARVGALETTAALPWLEYAAPTSNFARAIASPGDLDGDGLDDLVIGDAGSSAGATAGGAAWVVRGSTTRLVGPSDLDAVAWSRIVGLQVSGGLGASLQGLGDLDADGAADLAVGAPYVTGGQPASGVVALYLGMSGGLLRVADASHVIDGIIGSSGFGGAMAHGDVDGDGAGDLVVAASASGYLAGETVIFLGAF